MEIDHKTKYYAHQYFKRYNNVIIIINIQTRYGVGHPVLGQISEFKTTLMY